eukprot:gnl/TRDRNA2_/TRDRNA2_35097_c0_seq1.p1 gnl/TRDRNA2_/TRDRNA2_35097_c0~~gnl/TRDRNA2_/TRDRNA2_35097_c0_seq1.p1  ORF type:complete len:361 (+),score=79.93 gnl/TRDRNA2_/TRDRNA2_35097_c0_seq1:55-1083(+)
MVYEVQCLCGSSFACIGLDVCVNLTHWAFREPTEEEDRPSTFRPVTDLKNRLSKSAWKILSFPKVLHAAFFEDSPAHSVVARSQIGVRGTDEHSQGIRFSVNDLEMTTGSVTLKGEVLTMKKVDGGVAGQMVLAGSEIFVSGPSLKVVTKERPSISMTFQSEDEAKEWHKKISEMKRPGVGARISEISESMLQQNERIKYLEKTINTLVTTQQKIAKIKAEEEGEEAKAKKMPQREEEPKAREEESSREPSRKQKQTEEVRAMKANEEELASEQRRYKELVEDYRAKFAAARAESTAAEKRSKAVHEQAQAESARVAQLTKERSVLQTKANALRKKMQDAST